MKWDLSFFEAASDAEDSTSLGEIARNDSEDLRAQGSPSESPAGERGTR
jgi:hypothetical protein